MMFERFTIEEINLMCIFDTGSGDSLIAELTAAAPDFEEPELTEMAARVLGKLANTSAGDFAGLALSPAYADDDEGKE